MNLDEQAYIAKLKPMGKSLVMEATASGKFYHYEPGNGTRYEVFISRRAATDHKYDDYYPKLSIAIMNFDRPCSMIVPVFDGKPDLAADYVQDKMGILPGDALAIIRLVDHFMKEQ